MQNHASQQIGVGAGGNSTNSKQFQQVRSGSQQDLYMLQKKDSKTNNQLATSSNPSLNSNKLNNSKTTVLSRTDIKFRIHNKDSHFQNTPEVNSPLQRPNQTQDKFFTKGSSRDSNLNNLSHREFTQRPHSQAGIISNVANHGEQGNALPYIGKEQRNTAIGQVEVNNEIISKLLQQTKSGGPNTPNQSRQSISNAATQVAQKTLQLVTKDEHLQQQKHVDEQLIKQGNAKSYGIKKQSSHLSSRVKVTPRDSPDKIANINGNNQGSQAKSSTQLHIQIQNTPTSQSQFSSSVHNNLTKNLNIQFSNVNSLNQYLHLPPTSPILNKNVQNTSQSQINILASGLKNLSTQETNESPRKVVFVSQKDLISPNETSSQNKQNRQFFPNKIDEIKSDQHLNEYYPQDQYENTPNGDYNNNNLISKLKEQQKLLNFLNTQRQRKSSTGQSDVSQSPGATSPYSEHNQRLSQYNLIKLQNQFDSQKARKSYGELQEIVQSEKIKPFNTTTSKAKLFSQDYKDNSESSSSKSIINTNQSFQKAFSLLTPQNIGLGINTNSSRASVRINSPSGISPQIPLTPQPLKSPNSQSWLENIRKMQNPLIIAGTEELEEQIKKELPNFNSDVPSNRNEVITLQKWFEAGLKSTSPTDDKKLFKYIYLSFSELVRQITLDCSERGIFLKEVVFRIVDHYQKQIQKVKDEISVEKNKSQEEIINTRKLYESIFEKKDKEMAELQKANEELKDKQSAENTTIASLQTREKDLNQQLNSLKSISQFLKEQLKKLSEDNLKLRMKLKKRKYNLDEKLVKQIQGDPKFAQELAKTQQSSSSQQFIKKLDQSSETSKVKLNSKQKSNQKHKNSIQQSFNEGTSFSNLPKFSQTKQNSSSDSDDSLNEKNFKKDLDEFSLHQPYIRKFTIDQQQALAHISQSNSNKKNSQSRRNSEMSNKSSSQTQSKDFKRASQASISSQNNFQQATHNMDLNKKILQIAIQEQIEENEISSFSSEDSKLIIDEAQNDMVDIEHLNAVGFLDPESAIKKECAETQVNASLFDFAFSTTETQTNLILADNKYDEFLINAEELDYLIDFRIQGFRQMQMYFESKDNDYQSIDNNHNTNNGAKLLKQPLSSYKGKFNKYERLYEENLQEVAKITQQIEKLNIEKNQFFVREKELLEEIASIKMQLKKEREEEQKRLEEFERKRKEEEEEAKQKKKKAQEIPDKWKNYQHLVSKKRMTSEGSPSNYKSTNAPKLGQRAIIDFEKQYQTDLGQIIIDKLSNKKYNKFKNFMPVSTILKQINLIYQDRIKLVQENPRFKEISCSNFSYIFLTKIFGLKKIVDQKFIIFILSLKRYMQIFRVNMFARFLGILEQKSLNFTLDEFNKYIETLDYIQNQCNIGKDLEISESETKYYVPYLKVAAFVGNFADARFTTEETTEFKKEVDQLKENDPRYPNVLVTDFDVFVHKMLNKYRMLVNRAKTYVINAFNASDLDGNGQCNLEEFLILNRNIESDNYNEDILTEIFNENADNIVDGEPNLTFDKFAVVCVDFNLFSDEAQDKFLGLRHKRELDIKYEDLKKLWPQKKIEYEKKINSFKFTEQEIQDKWMEITSVLNDRLTSSETQEVKPLLIAEKILERELEFLEIFEQEGFEDEEALNKYMDEGFKSKVTHLPENIQQQAFEKMKSTLMRKSTFNIPISQISEDQSQIKSFLQSLVSVSEKDLKKTKATIKQRLQEKLEQFETESVLKSIDQFILQNQGQSPRDSLQKQDSQITSIKLLKNSSEVQIPEQLTKQQLELLSFVKQELENINKK